MVNISKIINIDPDRLRIPNTQNDVRSARIHQKRNFLAVHLDAKVIMPVCPQRHLDAAIADRYLPGRNLAADVFPKPVGRNNTKKDQTPD